jgi:hypothetical protein
MKTLLIVLAGILGAALGLWVMYGLCCVIWEIVKIDTESVKAGHAHYRRDS